METGIKYSKKKNKNPVSSQKIYDSGFKCHYDLDDGIKQLINMYKILIYSKYGS